MNEERRKLEKALEDQQAETKSLQYKHKKME